MMAKNHVDYSHKVHKGIEFKIHKEDMTAEDLYAIMAMVDKHHEQGYHFTCHSKDALVERKIHVNEEDISVLEDMENFLELQVHTNGQISLLFRKDISRVFSLCGVIGENSKVVTVYPNKITQRHDYRDKHMYKKGIPVKKLLH